MDKKDKHQKNDMKNVDKPQNKDTKNTIKLSKNQENKKIQNKKGEKHMAVSMGVLPTLTEEQGKILLNDMRKGTIKKEQIEGCGERLKKIIEEQGL